ncbi:hypothetical protein B0H14DRAFT_2558745 [Mycena olivaceomarginata]|nr:hypothetical protein B0H14DRAFT_2558745 [Mycena olivaceomarginata]
MLTLFRELNDAFGPQFVQPIANIMENLINIVPNVKRNKEECARLMENIQPVLYAIINLYLRSEPVESLAPALVDNIGKFLKWIATRPAILNDIGVMKKTVKHMHEESLELIETLSDDSTSSDRSSVYLGANMSNNSSSSFSMLPTKPKIFYGRESEVKNIMELLSQQSPRIALLEEGGMGKTSLAKAILHHPDTCSRISKHQH